MKMKYFVTLIISMIALSWSLHSGDDAQVGIVSFKRCIEESKLGKDEQNSFEAMKKQMTEVLENTEQELTDLSKKFSDADYIDSLSPESEEELKIKFQTLNQELAKYQNQYYHALNAANAQLIDTISNMINQAAEHIAKDKDLNIVLNEYTAFYFDSELDITNDVIVEMDKIYKERQGETKEMTK